MTDSRKPIGWRSRLETAVLIVLVALPIVLMQWSIVARIDGKLAYRCLDQNKAREIGNDRAKILKESLQAAVTARREMASSGVAREQNLKDADRFQQLADKVEMVPPLDCSKENI